MIFIDAQETERLLEWGPLVEALRDMFRHGCETPVRHHHAFAIPGEPDGTLLLMPAWRSGAFLGVKLVNVVPGNAKRGLPAIDGCYILCSATDGRMLAMIDGATLTARRTAATSALASSYLSREDSSRLLVVGTGALSSRLAAAHSKVRRIRAIAIWGRNAEKAASVAAGLQQQGLPAEPCADLEAAVRRSDIISCATLSTEPLIRGDWLPEGAHLDLIGAFKPSMRESDDTAVERSSVFVDTCEGALKEAGDLVQPMGAGRFKAEDIRASLGELCNGSRQGRVSQTEITLFKSVGASLEDLAASMLAYQLKTKARQAV